MSTVRKTIARDLRDGSYIEITAEERDDTGTLSPGFSITAEVWESYANVRGRTRKRMGRESDMGGCCHDEILKAVPNLRPLVTAHLATPDGTPMHAAANGWYYYSGRASSYEREKIAAGKDYGYSRNLARSDHERAAAALSIDAAELPENIATRDEFTRFVESLSSTYAEHAAAARAALSTMVDGDGIEPVR